MERKRLNRFLLVLLLLVSFAWQFIYYNVPPVIGILSLKVTHPLSTSFMRYKSFKHPFERIKYDWVPANKISPLLKLAVILAEDDKFFQHSGIDWEAVQKAAKYNWKKKAFKKGASTISQQLAKNLFLFPSKDPVRKFREAYLALFLDAYLSKDRILELYLNVVEFGPNVYGAEAASHYYFKSPARSMSPEHAAFLASILPNPIKKGKGGFHMNRRAQLILNRIH